MKKFAIHMAGLGLAVAAATIPTVALAQQQYEGWHYFNDGAGTCGYVSCSAYGCTLVDTFPCPREVRGSGNGG